MHDEFKFQASKHGLSCETWTIGSHLSTCPQIILVAVEACAWDTLKIYITTLIRMGRLARIAIDEAHLVLQQSSFRPCLDMLEYLGQMPTSILLMTATCMCCLESKLFKKVGQQVYQVLHQSTDRPEIAQTMIVMSPVDFENAVRAKISFVTQNLDRSDRALLFCLSRDECD